MSAHFLAWEASFQARDLLFRDSRTLIGRTIPVALARPEKANGSGNAL
jgi:hypothetical protein